MINLLKRVALASFLTLAGLVPISPPASAAPPYPLPGHTVIEAPAYPGVSTKQYVQVSTADYEAAKAAQASTARDVTRKLMPPAPQPALAVPQKAAKLVTCAPICRHYGRILENADADPASGLSADITIGKPFTQSGANHSLGEIAVSSADQQDIVEVMWRVNTVARPDGNPILEAYHWIDGTPQGYRVGYVDNAANPVNLGAGLPKPVNKNFAIGSDASNFYVGYDGAWVATLPKSRFGADEFALAADQVQIGQGFYEVAADGAAEEHPCDDMGTGWDSNPFVSGTGSIFNFAWTGSATAVNVTGGIVTNPAGITGNADAYHFATTSANSGRGSGPGWNAAGTAAGTKDAC
jgi:hypothetical protein